MRLFKGKSVVMAIPDTQYPFAHEDHLNFLLEVKKKYKPDEFVHLGDEVDFHALSDYDHDPDGFSAGDELKKALEDMRRLYKHFPKMKVCVSNHTSRPFRRAYKFGLPKVFLKDYHDFLEAPKGWQWADEWEVDGVLFEHGESFGGQTGALRTAIANMQSTVIGHLHSFAGINYYANPHTLIFGFNTGCLIDKDTYAFNYGKKQKNKPILGCGIIYKGVPIFEPMILNSRGRWIGTI